MKLCQNYLLKSWYCLNKFQDNRPNIVNFLFEWKMCPVPNSNNQSINIICSYRCSRYVPVAYRTAKSHLVKVGVIFSYRTFSNFNEAKNLKSFDLPFQKSPYQLCLDLHGQGCGKTLTLGHVKILFDSKPSKNLQK